MIFFPDLPMPLHPQRISNGIGKMERGKAQLKNQKVLHTKPTQFSKGMCECESERKT